VLHEGQGCYLCFSSHIVCVYGRLSGFRKIAICQVESGTFGKNSAENGSYEYVKEFTYSGAGFQGRKYSGGLDAEA